MMRIRSLVVVSPALVFIALGVAYAGDPVSPLFAARLNATLAEWEAAALPVTDGGTECVPWWPVSAQPASVCVGSLCAGSLCLGSLCVSSDCIGSGCISSGCTGSGCVGSICLGSGCAGSLCAGSACMGTTLCIRACGRDGGPPTPQDPHQPGAGPSSSPMSCPEN